MRRERDPAVRRFVPTSERQHARAAGTAARSSSDRLRFRARSRRAGTPSRSERREWRRPVQSQLRRPRPLSGPTCCPRPIQVLLSVSPSLLSTAPTARGRPAPSGSRSAGQLGQGQGFSQHHAAGHGQVEAIVDAGPTVRRISDAGDEHGCAWEHPSSCQVPMNSRHCLRFWRPMCLYRLVDRMTIHSGVIGFDVRG
jgi:hypothetical protein